MKGYIQRLKVWGRVVRGRYADDLFFHTAINVIFVSAGFVVVCVAAFALSLWLETVSWYIYVGILLAGMVCWISLVRVMVRPARDTLHYQKLFISNIAHELRTPLSTIKTSTEVELLDEKIPTPIRKNLLSTLNELDRISEIIDNLLSLNVLNRPEHIEFKNVDLAPVLDVVVKRLSPLARERGVQMIVKKEDACIVWGNAKALDQVMTNIIKNALSYTPQNTNGVVTISVHPSNGSVMFSVVDTGVGISQKDLFHIFEPFYRVDLSRVRNIRKMGSGLGLTIVNEIVRAHRGKINIQSTPHKGTTISVSFPPGVESSAAPSPKEKRLSGGEVSIDFSNLPNLKAPPKRIIV